MHVLEMLLKCGFCSSTLSCMCGKSLSHVRLFATPRTVARQAPLSVGFSRREYWSGLPCPPPGGLPDPGIKLRSHTLQAVSLPSEPPRKPPVFSPAKVYGQKGLVGYSPWGQKELDLTEHNKTDQTEHLFENHLTPLPKVDNVKRQFHLPFSLMQLPKRSS